MEVNPYKNNGLNAYTYNGNNSRAVINTAQLHSTTPIRDRVSFTSKQIEKNDIQKKPFGARLSQFVGKVMNDVANLPQKMFKKSQPMNLHAESLTSLGQKDNIYTF